MKKLFKYLVFNLGIASSINLGTAYAKYPEFQSIDHLPKECNINTIKIKRDLEYRPSCSTELNQGQFGSCYFFSAVNILEYYLSHNEEFKQANKGVNFRKHFIAILETLYLSNDKNLQEGGLTAESLYNIALMGKIALDSNNEGTDKELFSYEKMIKNNGPLLKRLRYHIETHRTLKLRQSKKNISGDEKDKIGQYINKNLKKLFDYIQFKKEILNEEIDEENLLKKLDTLSDQQLLAQFLKTKNESEIKTTTIPPITVCSNALEGFNTEEKFNMIFEELKNAEGPIGLGFMLSHDDGTTLGGHAITLLGAAEIECDGKTYRFLDVLNSWGKEEYSGKFYADPLLKNANEITSIYANEDSNYMKGNQSIMFYVLKNDKNNFEKFKEYLSEHPESLENEFLLGLNMAHIAIISDNSRVLKYILKEKPELLLQKAEVMETQVTPLHMALMSKNKQIYDSVLKFIQNLKDRKQKDQFDLKKILLLETPNPLNLLANPHNIDLFKMIDGSFPTDKNNPEKFPGLRNTKGEGKGGFGSYPLCAAIENSAYNIVEYLLDTGVNLNISCYSREKNREFNILEFAYLNNEKETFILIFKFLFDEFKRGKKYYYQNPETQTTVPLFQLSTIKEVLDHDDAHLIINHFIEREIIDGEFIKSNRSLLDQLIYKHNNEPLIMHWLDTGLNLFDYEYQDSYLWYYYPNQHNVLQEIINTGWTGFIVDALGKATDEELKKHASSIKAYIKSKKRFFNEEDIAKIETALKY